MGSHKSQPSHFYGSIPGTQSQCFVVTARNMNYPFNSIKHEGNYVKHDRSRELTSDAELSMQSIDIH